MEPKRFYRSSTDRKLGGVSAGIAEYFNMDPLLIRLLFIILVVAGGSGVLIYIILWIVTPENPDRRTSYTQHAGAGNSSFEAPAGSGYTAGEPTGDSENPVNQPSNQAMPPDPQTRERNKGSLIGGLVLITLGGLFLAEELIPRVNFGDLWPVILIVIGLGLLFNTLTGKTRNNN
jgi:phage shock protein C